MFIQCKLILRGNLANTKVISVKVLFIENSFSKSCWPRPILESPRNPKLIIFSFRGLFLDHSIKSNHHYCYLRLAPSPHTWNWYFEKYQRSTRRSSQAGTVLKDPGCEINLLSAPLFFDILEIKKLFSRLSCQPRSGSSLILHPLLPP